MGRHQNRCRRNSFGAYYVIVLTVLSWGWLNPSAAEELPLEVYFAGVSMIGDFNQNEIRYPVASRIWKEETQTGSNLLDDTLNQVLVGFENPYLDLKKRDIKQKVDNTGSAEYTALSFALTDESVESNRWEDGYIYVYRVIAQILVFDFGDKMVIANYPVMVMLTDQDNHLRDEGEHAEIFRRIYLDPDYHVNIFKTWSETLRVQKIKREYGNYCRVRNVEVSDRAKEHIPARLLENNAFQSQTAQIFEFILSTEHGVPLIPYTKGQAVGRSMCARFADASACTKLGLNDAEHVIDLRIRNFKHLRKETEHRLDFSFGAYINVRVQDDYEPYVGRVRLDSKFRNINTVQLAKVENLKLDVWFGYQNSLRSLLGRFSKQIREKDRDTLKRMTKAEDIMDQLAAMEEVINKCK